jgi:hypothetical protein
LKGTEAQKQRSGDSKEAGNPGTRNPKKTPKPAAKKTNNNTQNK